MKLSDYKNKLNRNKEFVEAKNELQLQFELGNAVLRARLEKGLSQTELANAIGTKQANISRIEAGLGNPTISLIQKIATFLELKVSITANEIVSEQSKKIYFSIETISSSSILMPDWPQPIFSTDSLKSSAKEEAIA